MEHSEQKELFARLEREFRAIDLEVALVPGSGEPQLGDTMRVLLGVTEEAVPALMELMLIQLPDGTPILQMYTTLTSSLAEGRAELEAALPAVNFYCPIGSFGIFNGSQLYHKYAVVLNEEQKGLEVLGEDIMSALAALYNVLDHYASLALSLASGNITLAQAQEAGLLPVL